MACFKGDFSLISTIKQPNSEDDTPHPLGKHARAIAFFVLFLCVPIVGRAFSITDFIRSMFLQSGGSVETAPIDTRLVTARPEPVLNPVNNADPKQAIGGAEILYAGDNALLPAIGPFGNVADVDEVRSSRITTYVVREGENLSVIADTFGVSIGTIFWANNLKRADLIKPGQVLVILPITGAQHTVKEGETIESIAKKYKADTEEILTFNELASSDSIAVGQEILIPNIDLEVPKASLSLRGGGGPNLSGYFARPLVGGTKTQGLHGWNGVDLAAPCGTPLYAAASGSVVIARNSGWNGGYGKYIVITHPNGTQTVYSHMQAIFVVPGQYVVQNQQIGLLGTSGRSTGCHIHFEVRGAANPF